MSAPTRRRRRLPFVVAALAVVVAAAVVLAVRPWQTVTNLPAQACWGVLTADDLRPLAGQSGGTMSAATTTTSLQPASQATDGGYHCVLSWQGGQAPANLGNGPTIALYTAAQLHQAQALDASRGAVQPLSFGGGTGTSGGTGSGTNTGLIAWQAAYGYTLDLAFPCTYHDPFSGQVTHGYARVSVDAAANPSGDSPAPPSDVRQADAGIVLKLAKAFAQQYPCGGVTLPAVAPSVPAYQTIS
ncbi:hypothetical protein [Streptacidiphilus fuscans]|uniref:Uncharacterized protein n=1 Tax=Streptacidiphilus fuscans TaxID=2789292 RepID=A0A931BDM8_9ACTN|nr:hypothetical protein [Streptacidiphilus fuscans]MBF9073696.1 hypothetical protein [Streptacidiphilus fuscans]